MMAGLSSYPAVAVLRADNLDRATKFYTEVLGFALDAAQSGNGVAIISAGMGSQLSLYERPGMPAPANTTLAIPVPPAAFDSTVTEMRGRGVVFEEYDIPEMGLKTVNGVADTGSTKSAWFKDTEGNILNLVSM
ncbi:MAG: VOC family protein [Coriobacteriia bacterium]|nr:VOC family protein [Coriobacteriia bacterium]